MRPWEGLVQWILYEYGALLVLLLVAATFGWGSQFVATAVLVGGVAAAVAFAASRWRPAQGSQELAWHHLALLGALVGAAWGLRRLPYRETSVPLGYDYGFYAAAFDAYVQGDRPLWVDQQFPPGLPLLHSVMEGATGLSAHDHLVHLFPLLAALTALSVFVVVRRLIGTWGALFAAALASASMTMFTAYEYLYEKNILAMVMVATMLFLVQRRHHLAAGIVLGAIGIWHRPTFLWAVLGVVLYVAGQWVGQRVWRPWLRMAGAALLVIAPVWLLMPQTFFHVGLRVAEGAGAALASDAAGGTGTFFDVHRYAVHAAAYLGLAMAAVTVQRLRPWALLGVVAALWVLLELPLHNRFILMLDLAAVVLAAAALWTLLPSPRWRGGVAVVLVVLTATPTIGEALDPSPSYRFVTDAELEDIRWMRSLPEDATFVSSNLQAPYVIAETGRDTIGPGLFGDPANRGDWDAAMRNASTLAAFLEDRGDVYIYQGRSVPFVAHLMPGERFRVVHQTPASTVWHLEDP